MNHAVVEKNLRKLRILVAPLDWGLGHATRCIPLIHELLARDWDVWLAGEGAQEKILRSEFPYLTFLQLEGYRVRYAGSAAGLIWQILVQSPKFFRLIRKENKWLKDMVKAHGFDAVISDNRFGLYHKKIPSIFITHQLTIKTPVGKWSERLIQKRNYRYINRFLECWVPDAEGPDNLAGELSHPMRMPSKEVRYIGALSRFRKMEEPIHEKHLLFVLSGPEPQRSILENKIVAQIAQFDTSATIVRGLPGEQNLIPSTSMLRFYNHLKADQLNLEMARADIVICRSGYSSVMDLARLGKKSILIPTPGQTEQEYIAGYMMEKKLAYAIAQNNFSLTAALEAAENFPYMPMPEMDSGLKKAVDALTKFVRPV